MPYTGRPLHDGVITGRRGAASVSLARHLPALLLIGAVSVALAALLPAAVAPPNAAHAQATPPSVPPIGNYTAGGGDGQFRSPEGIAMYRDGTLVVADTGNHRVQVFSPNGTHALTFGSEGNGTGELSFPRGVSLARDGRIIVADTFNHRVQVFHPNGTHALTFGSEGNGTGELRFPAGASQGRFDDFIVADTGNHRIQNFFSNGTFVYTFGSRGNGTGQEFESPTAALGNEPGNPGTIIVADTGNDRIMSFQYAPHPDGRITQSWYANPLGPPGDGAREFAGPRSLDWAPRGLIAADTGNDRIQRFSSTLSRVFDFAFGSEGTGPGQFREPEGAAMNGTGSIAVADTGNHRIQVFHPNLTLAYALGLPTPDEGGNVTDVPPPPVVVPPPDPGPPAVVVPSLPPIVVQLNGTGPSQVNVTAVGHAANLTIDVAGLADSALDGTASSTVTFPPTETIVAASFATVSFPPNVTASHVPADGRLVMHVSADVPSDDQVQLLAYEGSGNVTLQRVVEVGGGGRPGQVTFDQPVRILLEGQGGGRAFYINGWPLPIDLPCGADDTSRVHRELGGGWGPGAYDACQIDSDDGTDKIIYTYRLTRFGTVLPENAAAPLPAVPICALSLSHSEAAMTGTAGGYSEVVSYAAVNSGNLPFTSVEAYATPWYAGALSDVGPGTASLPASLTEVSTTGASGRFVPFSGPVVLEGSADFAPSTEMGLFFRVDIPADAADVGTTFAQNISYVAECGVTEGPSEPVPVPAPTEHPLVVHSLVVVAPPPPPVVVPSLPPIVVQLNGTGPSQVNVTAVGHAANLTIDVAGLADSALDGTASSTVTFPPTETIVAASFATVSFPPNVTASHVPADGRLALRIAADVPSAEQVQGALAYEGSGNVMLQRVVEVGGGGPGRVVFDMPVRIFLEGQAGGRAFYIDGADGAITPIDTACAADDTARVHVHLGGAGECQIDSADGGKVVYTYHLTRFGTVLPDNAAALPPTIYTCAVGIGAADLGVSMAPGKYSAPVHQTIINQGSLPFERVGLDATPWSVVPGGGPPQDGGLLATEVAVVEGAYDALSEGTAVAHGLGGGVESTLWFRVLAGSGLQGGTLAQDVTYRAECAGP